jgi:hypothetical protein
LWMCACKVCQGHAVSRCMSCVQVHLMSGPRLLPWGQSLPWALGPTPSARVLVQGFQRIIRSRRWVVQVGIDGPEALVVRGLPLAASGTLPWSWQRGPALSWNPPPPCCTVRRSPLAPEPNRKKAHAATCSSEPAQAQAQTGNEPCGRLPPAMPPGQGSRIMVRLQPIFTVLLSWANIFHLAQPGSQPVFFMRLACTPRPCLSQ